MKNKKGFTLIELLAVIVIIAIVSSIATVGIISIRGLINESLLDSKIDILESGAVYWGQDSMVLLVKEVNSYSSSCYLESPSYDAVTAKLATSDCDNTNLYIKSAQNLFSENVPSLEYYAVVKSVNDLSEYISKGDTCYDSDSYSCVKNDVTGEDMGEDLILIYVSNNRVYAKYIEES